MAKFHLSDDGTPKKCDAQKGRCPMREPDGSPAEHYEGDSAVELIDWAEKKNSRRAGGNLPQSNKQNSRKQSSSRPSSDEVDEETGEERQLSPEAENVELAKYELSEQMYEAQNDLVDVQKLYAQMAQQKANSSPDFDAEAFEDLKNTRQSLRTEVRNIARKQKDLMDEEKNIESRGAHVYPPASPSEDDIPENSGKDAVDAPQQQKTADDPSRMAKINMRRAAKGLPPLESGSEVSARKAQEVQEAEQRKRGGAAQNAENTAQNAQQNTEQYTQNTEDTEDTMHTTENTGTSEDTSQGTEQTSQEASQQAEQPLTPQQRVERINASREAQGNAPLSAGPSSDPEPAPVREEDLLEHNADYLSDSEDAEPNPEKTTAINARRVQKGTRPLQEPTDEERELEGVQSQNEDDGYREGEVDPERTAEINARRAEKGLPPLSTV